MTQNHKSQFTSGGFTICTVCDALCPQTLDSEKGEKKHLGRKLERNLTEEPEEGSLPQDGQI